jgi:rhodanese-related sulfurtransferase
MARELLRCSSLFSETHDMNAALSRSLLVAIASGAIALPSFAQQAAAPAASAASAPAWTYKTQRLDRLAVDKLLAKPQNLLVLDVRRPDEHPVKGSFPVYLTIQYSEVEKSLAYLPKDRTILTVSNRAHRAGAVGDLLSKKGFKVAGATGTLDYEDQGGKAVVHIVPPEKKPAAAQ